MVKWKSSVPHQLKLSHAQAAEKSLRLLCERQPLASHLFLAETYLHVYIVDIFTCRRGAA